MKNKIVFLMFILLTCFFEAQTVDIKEFDGNRVSGYYYKDVTNSLDPYEGTWIYDNGTDYIKIVLVKKEHQFIGFYYQDLIIGEFLYKKNGVTQIDTLSNLNSAFSNVLMHGIDGSYFFTTPTPFDDAPNNERLTTSINENNCVSTMDIRLLELNGQPAIEIFKRRSHAITACEPIIPGGFYYLLKE